MHVMIMQTVLIVMVVTGVSVCQDSREMATVVQVNCNILYPPLSTTTLAYADINECENVTCGENAECLNTEGSYSCGCKSGFTGDGYNCTSKKYCTL